MHRPLTTATDFPGLDAPRRPAPSAADRARREAMEKRVYVRRMAAVALAQHGLGGMNLHALARAIHLPPSTLSYHYGTREELLGDLVADHLLELTQRVCAAFDASGEAPPAARMTAMLLALLDGIAADPHAHAVATHGSLALSARDREATSLRWQVLLSTLAEPLIASSPTLAERPRLAAALVQCVAGGCGDAQAWFAGLDGLDRGAQARRLAGMLLAGAGAERDGHGPAGGCGGPSLACAQAWVLAAADAAPGGDTPGGDVARDGAAEDAADIDA
ncbi:MAG: TetR/AcrR family transcriptional regulator [Acetobacteraceae bacterium]|nr:TetR/AcrR family transcriptional regulator [Acetobacteraceae bacterium]